MGGLCSLGYCHDTTQPRRNTVPVEPNPERDEIQARTLILDSPQAGRPIYSAVIVERALDRLTAAVERLTNTYERAHRVDKRRRGE